MSEATSTVDRTFAVMLADLEDAETMLVQQQAKLARQLADVDAELARIAAVKAAVQGKTLRTRRRASLIEDGRPPVSSGQEWAVKAVERSKPLLQWAQNHAGEFTAAEISDALGLSPQGLGPRLAGMVRRGELTAREGVERSPGGKVLMHYRAVK